MLDSSIGFSLIASTIITLITYVATRGKNKSEKEQKDKLNDMVVIFIICFTVIMIAKVCLSGNDPKKIIGGTTRIIESKGGQCPF